MKASKIKKVPRACECPAAGFCNRHQVNKGNHWHELCKDNEDYRQAWDDNKGPGQLVPGVEYFTPSPVNNRVFHAHWREWHTIANPSWQWLLDWLGRIPGCSQCKEDMRRWVEANRPRFDDWISYACEGHNYVNRKLAKKEFTIDEAEKRWSKGVFWPWTRSLKDVVPSGSRCVLAIAPDDWSKQQIEITRPSFEAYAKRCGAQFIELNQNVCPMWPMGNKFFAWEVAELFDQTFYVDCDVVLKPSMPDLFSAVPVGSYAVQDELPTIMAGENSKGYLQQCLDYAKTIGRDGIPSKIPNGGVLLLPRNATAYAPSAVPVTADWCMDQFLLAYNLPEDKTVWLDDRYNWGWIRKDWQNGLDDAYAIHLNGCHNRELRLKWLRELMEKYQ